ncbi:unnamed protein product [Paramecium sonneborni]|uniref:Uncharacterized protein n=1 Tax=Paramecium sonneborni TaxID=65129 RepID=A0A8S1PV26_9CILI|nr:unnamed protein product [Paramecium sonneborni]
MEIKIPFEIKSLEIFPNIIVKRLQFFRRAIKELISSESCLDGYRFPRYCQ